MKLCLLLLIPLLTACSYGVYVPANQNVPLFQKKGESRLEAGLDYVQGALAVSRQVGLLANVQYDFGGNRLSLNQGYGRTNHRRIEIGAGYFKPLGANATWVYETYAGLGVGWLRWTLPNRDTPVDPSGKPIDEGPLGFPNGVFTAPNANIFVQPSIGYRGRKISIALSTKLNYIGYGHADHELVFPNTANTNALAAFSRLESSPLLSVEPALTARVGGRHFQVTLQAFSELIAQNRWREWGPRDYLFDQAYFLRGGLCWQFR